MSEQQLPPGVWSVVVLDPPPADGLYWVAWASRDASLIEARDGLVMDRECVSWAFYALPLEGERAICPVEPHPVIPREVGPPGPIDPSEAVDAGWGS